MVAIAGGSGSGKSWLAERLASRLSPNATRLSLDDFYRDRSHLPESRRARLNFDHPQAIDWPSFERALRRLKSGKMARVPCYDFKTHCRGPTWRCLKPARIILVEGLWLLRRPAVRGMFTLRIFLKCSRNLRLRRRLARDGRERGRTAASIRRQFSGTVEPMHARFVVPQTRWADLTLDGHWGLREINRIERQLRALSSS